MSDKSLSEQLAEAKATIEALQRELAETNHGLVALSMELDNRVEQRTAELAQANQALCSEINERRQVEELLRENQDRLKLFIDGAPAGIAVFDREMRYIAVSKRYLADYHLVGGDIIGRSHYEVIPDIPQRWRDIHRRCLAGETDRRDEDHFLRADNSARWVRWEIRPWFLGSGEVGGIILFTEDITSRKRAEDELRIAKAAAERANDAKSHFLAAASHDLRQPLAALSLYVGTLKNKLATDDPLAENMQECVANLSDMLSDLLDLSKLAAGVVKPDIRDFLLGDVLAKVVSSHSPEARKNGLALRLRTFGAIGRTDPLLFQRIVANLVSNAIRYTERGGVLIGCRRRNGKVWVEVWDTGIGIPADKTTEIFEEFRQLGNYERNRAKGTGLGLAIVAKKASLLNLEVRVRSTPGRGSVFAVEVPPGEYVAPAIKPEYVHRPLRIALVEDNQDVVAALTYALTNVGHKVVWGTSRAELLGRLDGMEPEVIISDYRLAGEEDGFGVIDSLRKRYGNSLPAILVTGDTDPAVIQRMAKEAIRVQHKPLNLESLRATIAELAS